MSSGPLLESETSTARYTHLFASICEDDDGYTVQVKLYHSLQRDNVAWGEEITDSFETASALVAALAAKFSIAQACVTIDIRMHKATDATRH